MKHEERSLEELIPDVILPDGYSGKILLVSIVRGKQAMVALRSGDLWHREILRNTRAEIDSIGLSDAQVNELGGAYLCFETGGVIRIWGSSDEFGACDLEYAANLVRHAKTEWKVIVTT